MLEELGNRSWCGKTGSRYRDCSGEPWDTHQSVNSVALVMKRSTCMQRAATGMMCLSCQPLHLSIHLHIPATSHQVFTCGLGSSILRTTYRLPSC